MKAIPPLLMIAEGRKPRPRKAPRFRPKEHVLHMDVADLLRRHIAPGWLWSHYPSGELRDVRTASKLKAMGVQRGWPDLILLAPNGALHCLELKRIGEDLSDDQEAFQLWAIRSGVPFAVARTMAEVQTIFEVWRCLDQGLYNIQTQTHLVDNVHEVKPDLLYNVQEVARDEGNLYNVQDSEGGGS